MNKRYHIGDIVTFIRDREVVKFLESPDLLSGTGILTDVKYIDGPQKTKYIYHVKLNCGRVIKIRDRDLSNINIQLDSLADI